MKKVLTMLLALMLLTGCDKNLSLYGEYHAEDQPFVFGEGYIKKIRFNDEYCEYIYFGTVMAGKYEVKNNRIYIHTGNDLGILSMRKIGDNMLEGEGYIAGKFKKVK